MRSHLFIAVLFFVTSSPLVAGKTDSSSSTLDLSNAQNETTFLPSKKSNSSMSSFPSADLTEPQNNFSTPRRQPLRENPLQKPPSQVTVSRVDFMRTIAPTLQEETLIQIAITSSDPLSSAALCYIELSYFLSPHQPNPRLLNYLIDFFEGNPDFEEKGNYFASLQTLKSISPAKVFPVLEVISSSFPQFEKDGMGKLAFFMTASKLSFHDLKSENMNVTRALATYIQDSLQFTDDKTLTKERELLETFPEEERTESLLLINTKREALSKLEMPPSELLEFLFLVSRKERTLSYAENVLSLLNPRYSIKGENLILQNLKDVFSEKRAQLVSVATPFLRRTHNMFMKATLLRTIDILLLPWLWKKAVLSGLIRLFEDPLNQELFKELQIFSQSSEKEATLSKAHNLFQPDSKMAENMMNLIIVCNRLPSDDKFISTLGRFGRIQRSLILTIMASSKKNLEHSIPLELLIVLENLIPENHTKETIENLLSILNYKVETQKNPFTASTLLHYLNRYKKHKWSRELKRLAAQIQGL